MTIPNLAIFCGSNSGYQSIYQESTKQLARMMVQKQFGIVYGGAKVGLMGSLADEVLQLNGTVIGVMPQSLVDVEIAHAQLTQLHIVQTMSERKTLIAEISDGFIMLPGGPGSLDEFFEMYTLAQLGYHQKPCAIYNVGGYYQFLIQYLQHAVTEGFLKQAQFDMLIIEDDPAILIEKISHYQAPQIPKWISMPETEIISP